MAESHSTIAYPFTKSDRARDKVMSEVMITSLNKSLIGDQELVVISTYEDGSKPKEILIHGYYFYLQQEFASESDAFYIYVQADLKDNDAGKSFPELLQVMGSETYADHECIFNVSLKDDTSAADQLAEDLGATYNEYLDQYVVDGIPVEQLGGDKSSFASLQDLFKVFYIADQSDDSQKGRIWIKSKTVGSQVTILNPYVYFETAKKWVPLGAVYKEDNS